PLRSYSLLSTTQNYSSKLFHFLPSSFYHITQNIKMVGRLEGKNAIITGAAGYVPLSTYDKPSNQRHT
ncbi:hypothetical protein NL519_34575, partial [Klebsiella pneumoniae]|nr:hypothetical protein [Klebsiella pneumoniae]